MLKHQPRLLRDFVFLCIFVFSGVIVRAQVTTATLSGVVTGQRGNTLPGATVLVAFTDAGISKLLMTKTDGSFVLPNLRVGGPYTITVSYAGYSPKVHSNIYLNLVHNTFLEVRLAEISANLKEVVVTGRSPIFDDSRTGASTQI